MRVYIYIAFWSNPPASNGREPGLTLEREARLIGEPICYDKELERSLAINAKIGKNISVCLFPSAVNAFVCTSIIRARLYIQPTACDCLLDIGFAVVLISTSHSSQHRLPIILTSAARILDIGFAFTPTSL